MTNEINYGDFKKIDIRLGTIIEAKENNLLNKPSIVLKIDFGPQLGIKKSSAQIKSNYRVDQLINKQVVAVTNFKPKQVGKVLSEVLVFFRDKTEKIFISLLIPFILIASNCSTLTLSSA